MVPIASASPRTGGWPRLPWGALAIVVLGVAIQAMGQQICDNSWLILFAERVYEGATPYVDITDPNLPATWLIYMPAVALAKASGLRAEAFVVVEMLALTLVSGLFTTRILRGGGLLADLDVPAARAAFLFASLIVWGANFGQREHFAVLMLLPMLALCAVRAAGAPVPARDAILAGALAAGAVCIKPFYALPLGLPILAVVSVRRAPRAALQPENFAAALAAALYYAALPKLTPAYFSLEMPQLVTVYLAGRYPLSAILTRPMVPYLAAAFGILSVLLWRRRDPRVLMLAASAAGFFATYVAQGKMSFNHALPAIHLVVVAFGVEYARRRAQAPAEAAAFLRRFAAPAFALAPMFGLIHLSLLGLETSPGLRETVARLAPARPAIGAIVESFSVAFPLVRRLDGRWIGRASAIWGTDVGYYLLAQPSTAPEQKRRIAAVIHSQRAWLAEDLARGAPDVILVESAALRARELATPELAHALDGYRHAADASGVEIWLRAGAAARNPNAAARS
jgi:hypothetical protein